MIKTALLFPGQGSQSIGMGKDLYENFQEARLVFEEVDDVLGQKLSLLMFDGPLDELTLTSNTQPALMAVSLAVVSVLKKEAGFSIEKETSFLAGHSLGEYSALATGSAFSLAETARLLRLRGNEMQKAVPAGLGAMAALLGGTIAQAQELAASVDGICEIANDNSPDQQVISGHADSIQAAVAKASEFGFRRAILLPVSAPFHSSLMKPAEEAMAAAFSEITLGTLIVPVVANIRAEALTTAELFPNLLCQQIAGRVRWRESLLLLRDQGVERCLELGAGKVLAGLSKRTIPDVPTVSIGSVDDIKNFVDSRK